MYEKGLDLTLRLWPRRSVMQTYHNSSLVFFFFAATTDFINPKPLFLTAAIASSLSSINLVYVSCNFCTSSLKTLSAASNFFSSVAIFFSSSQRDRFVGEQIGFKFSVANFFKLF